MSWIFFTTAFVFGGVLASFLHVVAERLPQGLTLRGRSFCSRCRHQLAWRDLVPIVSFLFLLGKCRYCSRPISLMHPLGEAALGAIFALVVWQTSSEHVVWSLAWLTQLVFQLSVASALFAVFFSDLRHYIILDSVLLPAALVAGALRVAEDIVPASAFSPLLRVETASFVFSSHFLSAAVAGIVVLLFFAALVVVSQGRWMGLGDVKFVGYLGLALGWPAIFPAIFLAFFGGAVWGLALIFLNKSSIKGVLPFGTFLAAAALPFLIFGEQLTARILSSFLGLPSSSFM